MGYAPWCGHCKSLAPEYAKAAQQLEKDGSSVLLVKVDATVHGELAKEFGVGGYPTLKWFKNNDRKNPMDYKGGRKEAEIVSWVTKKSGPPAVPVEGTDAATKFKTDNEVAVVGFVSGDKLDAFNAAGDSFDDVPFGVLDADAAAALEVAEGQVALLKQFDDGRVNFDGEGSEALIAFVKVDCDVEDNKRVMEFFGITEENCPDMRVINMEKNMAKFAPEKSDLTADGVKAFVNGVLDGSIKRHLKSEEVPDNSGNAVKVVVGKNFNDLVLDPTKNVFVEFYAPWCGHCKSLAPVWEELGEKYKDHANIVIAKSDATANEFEDVEVQGFPTLEFFPAGGEMQDYNGGRTLEDFVKFLEPDAAKEEAAEEAEEAAADAKDEL